MDDNILQEILVVFQSNLPKQIEQWYQFLSKIIAECMNSFFLENSSFHLSEFMYR